MAWFQRFPRTPTFGTGWDHFCRWVGPEITKIRENLTLMEECLLRDVTLGSKRERLLAKVNSLRALRNVKDMFRVGGKGLRRESRTSADSRARVHSVVESHEDDNHYQRAFHQAPLEAFHRLLRARFSPV